MCACHVVGLVLLAAVDINLGCPLREAKEKRFGSYLLDEHEHECVLAMVRRVSAGIRIPLTCKIRLLPSLQQTVDFALKLEEAGCAMLTVHARLRTRPRDKRAGPANLDHVT
jgi:tRNA-dihydrouridine synthase 1